MNKREEREKNEKLKKLVRETPEERKERVTGPQYRPSVIPDKRNRPPKHKKHDPYERD